MTEPTAAQSGVGLSIVIPVYRGARYHRAAGRSAVRTATGRRVGDHPGERRQPRQFRRRLPRTWCASASVPLTYVEHARNYRRAQRRHDRTASRTRRLRDHHGRRFAEPAGGGHPAVRSRAARQLGRRLYALCGQAACRLAQSRQPVRQRGGRSAAGQAEGLVSVVVPLHVGNGGASR